jgi:hypothetical protein
MDSDNMIFLEIYPKVVPLQEVEIAITLRKSLVEWWSLFRHFFTRVYSPGPTFNPGKVDLSRMGGSNAIQERYIFSKFAKTSSLELCPFIRVSERTRYLSKPLAPEKRPKTSTIFIE